MVELMAAIEAREDQLVAALDQWNEARGLARERSGETAAEERSEQLYKESYDACARIASTRAHFERNAGEASLYCVGLRRRGGVGACGFASTRLRRCPTLARESCVAWLLLDDNHSAFGPVSGAGSQTGRNRQARLVVFGH
jgi:hypothetical protein